MPLIKISENNFPSWSEVKKINLIKIDFEKEISVANSLGKIALFFIEGNIVIKINDEEKIFNEGESLITNAKSISIKSKNNESQILIIEGNWKNETGNSGIFKMNISDKPKNIGDYIDYERNTNS